VIGDVPPFAGASSSVRIDIMESTEVGLRPPRHLVSPRARLYWAVRALAGWLLPLVVEIVWMIEDEAYQSLHVAGLVATVVLALAHVTVMPQWRYRVHRWESTPQAVYTQSGWFNQERRIAPVTRIQTVDSERGPFEQLFGLANVTVTTASAAGPLKIHGLDRETAQRLVDELTEGTQVDRSDAT
jgi:membrane protein YdbS with pleckstrin-like domain